MTKSLNFVWNYLVVSKQVWRFRQIFVVFSRYMNFSKIHRDFLIAWDLTPNIYLQGLNLFDTYLKSWSILVGTLEAKVWWISDTLIFQTKVISWMVNLSQLRVQCTMGSWPLLLYIWILYMPWSHISYPCDFFSNFRELFTTKFDLTKSEWQKSSSWNQATNWKWVIYIRLCFLNIITNYLLEKIK